MLQDIEGVLRNQGITYRKRSVWISDALLAMKQQPNFIQYIQEEWLNPGNNATIQISLESAAELALTQMLEVSAAELDKHNELVSSIVRASIIQAILKQESKTTEKQ